MEMTEKGKTVLESSVKEQRAIALKKLQAATKAIFAVLDSLPPDESLRTCMSSTMLVMAMESIVNDVWKSYPDDKKDGK